MANIGEIKRYCISNGEGLRTAVFFSGCDHYCKGCFNHELWDYYYGKPLDIEEYKPYLFDAIRAILQTGKES